MLYLSDELAECIKVYTLDGKLVRRIGETYFLCPAGMTIDSKGNIVMTDAEKCFVSVHHPKDGRFLTRFYYRFLGDLKVPCPYYTATNDDDHLIVSDFRNNVVKVFSYTGKILFKITKLNCPRGVCTDPYGNILIAEGDGHCVSMYSPYGKFLCKVLTEEDGLKYPLALDMNASGQLLVTQCGPFTAHEVLGFQLFL
jgi:sugar lactone lactonase YvrE